MITCGIKLTHDGAVALFEKNKLVFSVEMEKLNNNPRFKDISDLEAIEEILKIFGYNLKDVDKFVIDGWGKNEQQIMDFYHRLSVKSGINYLKVRDQNIEYELPVAGYIEDKVVNNTLTPYSFDGLKIGDHTFSYDSYLHTTGHILGTYMTSPFAAKNESSFVLVWDGGMFPHFYFVDASTRKVENLDIFFNLLGSIYSQFAQNFEPFKVGKTTKIDLALAGKVMAYIAYGKPQEKLFPLFEASLEECKNKSTGLTIVFAEHFKSLAKGEFNNADILYNFHVWLKNKLLSHLEIAVNKSGIKNRNLCLTGGCALNIKWNSDIRRTGIFDQVFVPPFPNDSGSALGTACCSVFNDQGYNHIEWSVYSGPEIIKNEPFTGWQKKECSIKKLAQLIYTSNEPIVFLNSRAEIGPRALGNRSIIASPQSLKMKEILNDVKNRESYRPVSPICKEERGEEIFIPGTKDSHMLFDHIVREEWLDKIPAVIHIDKTSRLQTINENENETVYQLLDEFEKLSSIPLLCNTSANYKGTGFFPDIFSVTKWNRVNYVWCDNMLYEKTNKIHF